MLGADNDQMRSCAQHAGKILDGRIRDDRVIAAGHDQHGLAQPHGITALAHRAHRTERRIEPRHGRAADPERRLRLDDRGVAGKTDRIRGENVAEERPRFDEASISVGNIHRAEARQAQHPHDRRPKTVRVIDAAEREQRRGQHHAVEPTMAAMSGTDQRRRAGGMADGEDRRRTIRQHDLAHEGLEIDVIFGKVAYIALATIAQSAV